MAKMEALALDDFEAAARHIMPQSLYAFIAAGSEAGLTRDANRAAFANYPLRTRTMRNVSARSIATTLFGHEYSAPIGIPPMGMSSAVWFEGDLELARAGRDANIPFILSGAAFEPLEPVVAEAPDAWFQAYPSGDIEADAALVARTAAAGYKVLVVTVDTTVPPSREAAMRAGGLMVPVRPNLKLAVDTLLHPRWAWGTLAQTLRKRGIPKMANMSARGGPRITDVPKGPRRTVRDTMGWAELKAIRDAWKGPLVIKGILAPEDAEAARTLGADAVIVSNHGGRQLDGTLPAIDALAPIVAVAGDMKILFDGGVRRGGDIAKALALGADMVFIGRPFLYALGAYGRPGVAHAIQLIQAELMRAMAMLGCTAIEDIRAGDVLASPQGEYHMAEADGESRERREILLAAALEAIPLDRHEFRREETDAYFELFAEDSDEELQFLCGRWLAFVMRKWRKALDERLRAAGHSFARWEILFQLSVVEPHGTLTGLAERIGVVGPTLVGMLDSLEREGLIARTRDVADRRAKNIVLTEAGHQAAKELRDLSNNLRAEFLSGISATEMKLLLNALKLIEANLRRMEESA